MALDSNLLLPTPDLQLPAALPPFSWQLARDLLSTYGSPLYVYGGDRLRQSIRHITRAIPYPRTRFHFASVTNGNISLLRIFRQEGWGLHANTPGDIYLGLQAGFLPQQIVYSGSNLSPSEMEQVLGWGVTTLNLDSLAQLELCCRVYGQSLPAPAPLRLGLRLNFPELTGDSRIGVHPQEFPAAIGLAQSAGLTLAGLHFYRGTGTNATIAFTQAIDRVLEIANQLPDWDYLDFGGGFGYPYHPGGPAFDWDLFGRELCDRLNRLNRPIDLVIEPGRAAIAGSAALLCKVVAVKWQAKKQIIGVDTTVANLSVPSVHGGYRTIVAWKESEPAGELWQGSSLTVSVEPSSVPHPSHPASPTLYPTDICGNTTYSRDYLGKNCLLPALKIDDMLAILDVGAYGYAMSSHFLHRPRPAEVLLDSESHRLIRQREDYRVLLENQVF